MHFSSFADFVSAAYWLNECVSVAPLPEKRHRHRIDILYRRRVEELFNVKNTHTHTAAVQSMRKSCRSRKFLVGDYCLLYQV